jgi:hypothetical protein
VGAFIARERRAPELMLPLRFFRSRGFSAGKGAIFLTGRLWVTTNWKKEVIEY